LSESDHDESGRWPQTDRRRGGDRRTGADRRASAGGSAPGPAGERRQGHRRQGRDRRDESAWQAVAVDGLPAGGLRPEQALLAAALGAREFAHAEYSNFKVGAALETLDGEVVTGCNIENATYGLTLCAERVALVKALSDGYTAFTRIAIVADTEAPTPPCGSCRQLLWEYCGDIDVILGNRTTLLAQFRLLSLLPLPFDRRVLR
jgi:cytidine deaminase